MGGIGLWFGLFVLCVGLVGEVVWSRVCMLVLSCVCG